MDQPPRVRKRKSPRHSYNDPVCTEDAIKQNPLPPTPPPSPATKSPFASFVSRIKSFADWGEESSEDKKSNGNGAARRSWISCVSFGLIARKLSEEQKELPAEVTHTAAREGDSTVVLSSDSTTMGEPLAYVHSQ
jgi:hypothetical protein